MELRYCDRCGKVLKLEGRKDEINPAEHFLCPRCKAGRAGSAPTKVEKKPQGALDFLTSPLEEGKLNLFSSDTVVRYKEKMKSKRSGLLGLRIEDQLLPESPCEDSKGSSAPARTAKKIRFRCLQCRTMLEIRPVQGASRMVCPKCKLNLFVDDTGVISKTPPSAPKPSPQGKPGGAPPPGSPVPRKGLRQSAHPEPVKLQFHCLHCRAVLRVEPVQEPSRMVCPKCKGDLFIDAAGIVSKVPPRVSRPEKPRVPPPAAGRDPGPAPAPAERRAVPPAQGKEAPRPARPKRARKNHKKKSAKSLVRVSTFLPADVVEEIEDTGEAKSKVIREIIEEKVKSAPGEGAPGPG